MSVNHSSEPSVSVKRVESGQVRLYYAGMCLCGWTGSYRVTRAKAHQDFAAHLVHA